MGGVKPRAVFLDRDGTLNVKAAAHEYITSGDDFVWLKDATSGLARLARAGYLLAIVSNQRGVGRGLFSADVLDEIEKRIQSDLASSGSAITAFRYCLHDYDATCDCRKPKPGLITRLADELDLDLESSWMIGDDDSDVLAGRSAGVRTVLIGAEPTTSRPDLVADSLAAASEMICATDAQPAPVVPTPDSNSAIRA